MYFRIFFGPKQDQGFKPLAAYLYPNIHREEPPPPHLGHSHPFDVCFLFNFHADADTTVLVFVPFAVTVIKVT